uniref:Uncharacterized protein n=1 Tax=Oryza brachyantha TaxID=4533 RepID=J3L6S5_ORYBR
MYHIICTWVGRERLTPDIEIRDLRQELSFMLSVKVETDLICNIPVHVRPYQATLIDDTKSIVCQICRNYIHNPDRICGHSCSETTKASIHVHDISVTPMR